MNTSTEYITRQYFDAVVLEKRELILPETLFLRVRKSHEFLKDFASNKIIYGVNTGFGPMAQYKIKEEDQLELQYNLIRSHCTGSGQLLDETMVRATIMARLNTLSLGFSGVHEDAIRLMQTLLNNNIIPVIFTHGGVGASGDLVQLAHLALVVIGEGEVLYHGKRQLTKDVFEQLQIKPLRIVLREALSLMNGTSTMTGIGLVNLNKSYKLLDYCIKISALINELVQAYDDSFSEALNASKLHEGQRFIAKEMRTLTSDSGRIRKREEHLYQGTNQEEIFQDKVQEYYSIRCVPQILGPVKDTLDQVGMVLERELNSASDNPIVSLEDQHVYHGGNFHGDYVSLEMDKMKLVVTRMSMLVERQLNYLLNPKINDLFPPFLNLGTLGFNFGLQGAQFTATSTTAENQTLSTSMYVHSIPNNNDNQDIVSMGTNAALLANRVIENTFEVVSIQLVAVCQAVDALKCCDSLSASAKELYDTVRNLVPTVVADQPLYTKLEELKNLIKQ